MLKYSLGYLLSNLLLNLKFTSSPHDKKTTINYIYQKLNLKFIKIDN